MTSTSVAHGSADDTAQHEVLPRLRGLTPTLVPSEKRVAEAILRDPAQVARMTIGELADVASTSQTTVMRLCHEIDISGYRTLRMALARESATATAQIAPSTDRSDIGQADSLDDVIGVITHSDSAAVLETGKLLDQHALASAIDAILEARRIDVFGVGASSFVALDLQQKLHRIGHISFSWPDQHAALTATALLEAGDVAIGISHTGATRDTVDIMQRAHEAGATTIAITAAPRSALARAVDFALVTAARETTFRSGAMASRIAALTVVDILFVAVAQRRYDQTLAALDATRRAVAHRRFGPSRRRMP